MKIKLIPTIDETGFWINKEQLITALRLLYNKIKLHDDDQMYVKGRLKTTLQYKMLSETYCSKDTIKKINHLWKKYQ